jgi:hypothetical protein
MKNKTAPLILLPFILAQTAFSAAVISEYEATPDVVSEPEAVLLLTEVNFKNGEADWAEIYYESPTGKPLNLKGISFIDDTSFKTIGDFTAASGQYILLTFKSAAADHYPYLYTDRSGLTGTTEQLILRDPNGRIIDAVCWTSATPTNDEIADMSDLYALDGWDTADTTDCIKSETVKNNQSIARVGFFDSNSSSDWLITEELTPSSANPLPAVEQTSETVSETEEVLTGTEEAPSAESETAEPASADPSETQSPAEEESTPPQTTPETEDTPTGTATSSINAIPGPILQAQKLAAEASTAPTPKKTASKTSGSSSKTKTPLYSDGDLSDDVILTELLPNPEGNDGKKEWVEITNIGDADVNLGNWILDDGENGSKPYTIPDTMEITSGSAMTLNVADTKISLGNTEDTVRLNDFKGTSVSEVSYEEAPSGQSYSYIETVGADGEKSAEWLWTANPTPDEPNPVHIRISGKITAIPVFEDKYFFKLMTSSNEEITVFFSEKEIQAPLAKATLLEGANLDLVLTETADGFMLVSYVITAPPVTTAPDMTVPGLVGSIFTVVGSSAYFLRRKIPWTFFLKGKA